MRVLIVGYGYVGVPLGKALLEQGHEVMCVRRTVSERPEELAVDLRSADISKKSDLEPLTGRFDWVVNLVSSSRGGVDEYQRAYLEGTRNLIEFFQPNPPAKYLYTSSTSVYGQTDGSWVREDSPVEPATDTGKVLVQTEEETRDAARRRGFPGVILRVAGIYGPGRGHLFWQYLRDEAQIVGSGERYLNMIHRDDLVAMIVTALKNGRPGEVYNAVDNEPVTQLHFFRWLSETLGKPMPPFVNETDAGPGKRGATNKRVSNRKAKIELAVQFNYPTFREGYTAELQRLIAAGELTVDLKPASGVTDRL